MKKTTLFLLSLAVLLAGCSERGGTLPDVPLKDAYSDCFLMGAAISTFQVGDRLFISGPTTGALWVDVSEIHDNDGNPTDVAQQHQLAAIRVPEKVRPNDKLFKIVKAES